MTEREPRAGEVRVINGVQVMARPSAVGDYLVWVNLEEQERAVMSIPERVAVELTRAQWAKAHMEMLKRGGHETRFREFMASGSWPPLPSQS